MMSVKFVVFRYACRSGPSLYEQLLVLMSRYQVLNLTPVSSEIGAWSWFACVCSLRENSNVGCSKHQNQPIEAARLVMAQPEESNCVNGFYSLVTKAVAQHLSCCVLIFRQRLMLVCECCLSALSRMTFRFSLPDSGCPAPSALVLAEFENVWLRRSLG